MRAMARNAAGDATLVEVKAVDGAWPRLGQAIFEPAMTPGAALARRENRYGAAVDDALLDRLGLKVGDAFDLGAARVEIRAKLVSEPDRLAAGIGFGPRVLISQDALRASGLVQPGSLVRWTTRVLMSAGGAPPSEAARRRRSSTRPRRRSRRRAGRRDRARTSRRTFRATSTASANSWRSSG